MYYETLCAQFVPSFSSDKKDTSNYSLSEDCYCVCFLGGAAGKCTVSGGNCEFDSRFSMPSHDAGDASADRPGGSTEPHTDDDMSTEGDSRQTYKWARELFLNLTL